MTDMLQKSENVTNNVANENSQDLTEQYKHGNLPDDRLYYYRFKGEPEVQITTQYGLYCEEADNKKEIEVIDFVPSYEEYEQLENWNRFTVDYHALREAKEIAEYEKVELMENVKQLKERNDSLNNRDINLCRIANGIRDENFALKELLKECKEIFDECFSPSVKHGELYKKIDEALR